MVACFSIVVSAFSQQMVIKPALGTNFTSFSSNPSVGSYKFPARLSNLGARFLLAGNSMWNQEFFYAKKSTDYDYDISGANLTTKYSLSGVDIPLAVGFSIIGGGQAKAPVGLRVFGGGSAFILTSVSEGSKSDYKSTTWGLFAGLGLDIAFLFLDVKYEWSLTNAQTNPTVVDIGEPMTLFINLGVRIPIEK